MCKWHLAGLILSSALITLDGTAVNVALPAIGRELSPSISALQWISNAPLLMLAAMLLPGGLLADRYGRARVMRTGLVSFVAASIACALAPSDRWLVAFRLAQGAAGALVLPAALAVARSAYSDPSERARIFGLWAAWTGLASVAGPLLAGGIIDVLSWRLVFAPSVAAGLAAIFLLRREPVGESVGERQPIPTVATAALVVLFGGLAYVLMQAPAGQAGRPVAIAVACGLAAAAVLARDPHRHLLLPRELVSARNCLPANAAAFAFYFGLFGLSFLVVLYVQQALGYSAVWAAIVLLPVSTMLLLAAVFGRLATVVGMRWLTICGAVAAALGIWWIAAGPHPLAFWSRLIAGTALFGLGISLSVSALTHAAVAAVPETLAGAASGLNHAVVRAAGLVAISILGSVAAPGMSQAVSADGLRVAMTICAAVVGAGGIAAAVLLRDDEPGGLLQPEPVMENGTGNR